MVHLAQSHLAQSYLDQSLQDTFSNQQSKPSAHTHRALLSNHFQLQLKSQLQFMDQLIKWDYQLIKWDYQWL